LTKPLTKENTMLQGQEKSEMKLSHAIREGAKLKPQSIWEKKHVGSSCALGAAADVVGCTIEHGGDDALLEFFPQLADHVPAVEELPAGTLRALVCGLNNGGRTREKIADILEEIGY
jgi:hypothetical protein